MKIYKFDPETGTRGELLDNVQVISYTSCSIQYAVENKQIKPIKFKLPVSNASTNWTAHIDAGILGKSYISDEWICFCMGPVYQGEFGEVWEWIVLPPKDLIEPL